MPQGGATAMVGVLPDATACAGSQSSSHRAPEIEDATLPEAGLADHDERRP
jgi:hypothetical protein